MKTLSNERKEQILEGLQNVDTMDVELLRDFVFFVTPVSMRQTQRLNEARAKVETLKTENSKLKTAFDQALAAADQATALAKSYHAQLKQSGL